MKIALNATIIEDKPRGLGVYAINIITRLLLQIENAVVFTAHPESFKSSVPHIRKVSSWVRPASGKFNRRLAAALRFLWTQTVLPLTTLGNRIDIYYSPTQHGQIWLPKGSSQVITVHDLLPLQYPSLRRHQQLYYRVLLPLVLKKSAAIITVSESTKRDLIQFYNYPAEKIHVVYNGYDQDVFKPSGTPASDGKYFLTINAHHPYKNIQAVLDAYKNLADSLEHELIIVTPEPDSAYMRELKSKVILYGLKKRVHFKGYVDSKELVELYHGATALVYPSLYEGFGLPPLEAMACGCPAIVSNTSSLPEVCGNAAYGVDPQDTAAISEAMFKVATDKALRKRLHEDGLSRAKLFSWDRAAEDIYEVMTKVHRESKSEHLRYNTDT